MNVVESPSKRHAAPARCAGEQPGRRHRRVRAGARPRRRRRSRRRRRARRALRARRGAPLQRARARRVRAPPRRRGGGRAQVVAALTGLGALQPLLDDPAVEEIWINAPDRVFVARDGVSQRLPLDARRARGARPRRADAAVHRPPRRPLVAVRRRLASRRLATARRHPRHHARALGGQHPQVQIRDAGARRAGAARLADAAGRRLPRPVRAHRPQHPGVGCDAERQDDAARRAARVGAGRRADRHGRGDLRARARRARTGWRCSAASRASRARARSRCAGSSRRRCGCGPTG